MKLNMRDITKPYTQPAFLICAGLLALASIAMERVHVKKVPFRLKKSLQLLDEDGLDPYKVIAKPRISNREVIKTLGTEEYIQWVLEDRSEPTDSTVRKCSLFITYYELPDNVPHVPEECYVGGGNQRLESNNLTFEIAANGARRTIPGRQLVFQDTGSDYWIANRKFAVFYLIHVSGKSGGGYANSRENARWLLNKNIFSEYVYFCKMEWNFLSMSGARTYPKKDKAVTASEKLLGIILPILEKDHWPNRPIVNDK
ncbi:MAG: hypothetical protein ACYSTF_01930 [Planctomycetota bacterium]|jgi:hypothetical protein